jgi:hypothetical protein
VDVGRERWYHPVAVLGVGVGGAARRGGLHGLEQGAAHDGPGGGAVHVHGGELLAVAGGALRRRERREMQARLSRRRHGGDRLVGGERHGSSGGRVSEASSHGKAAAVPEQEVLATRGEEEEEVLSVMAMGVARAGWIGGDLWGRRGQGGIYR